ncbi:sodium/calcium exchanger protein [Noviluteimonas gilva]|uniref:Sodium:proton exchanger n=1 Tax=Noviluteimonas gilva TaxID=2682097 RepID=A0A7C9HL28_9GAMM|nr:sodium:proton exchanger [Lysobacter gilvus]MUV13375.1 sodium:proton exchanger [Lysobacter gilvus]
MTRIHNAVREFVVPVAVAVAAVVPAVYLRLTSGSAGPLGDAALFGVAILASGFLLSWGAEAAEKYIATGFVLAVVALITVLPEYAVDFYYAYRAGQDPASGYVAYAAANMTGANRLLIGLAWPLLVGLHWWHSRQRGIALQRENAVEIVFLALASAYAFVIVLKDRIGVIDFMILGSLFCIYLWRVSQAENEEEEEDEEPGPGAVIALWSPARRWTAMAVMSVVAAGVILLAAEPFAESLVSTGRQLGMDEFLLIQWLAPLASEAPAVTITILFVLDGRARAGLTTMISDKINQWTLLVGMLPIAMSVGAGSLTSLPLDARQHEEFFLTAAQSLFALALLLQWRLSLLGAAALAVLFMTQLGLAFFYQATPAREIEVLTTMAWIYLALAALLLVRHGGQVPSIARAVWSTRSDATNARASD